MLIDKKMNSLKDKLYSELEAEKPKKVVGETKTKVEKSNKPNKKK